MILVVVEDLLFRSKISTAAKALGVAVGAATTAEAAIERASRERPTLVILDLDSARTQPLDVLARLKADPTLAGVPTLGFVSHVHADAIRGARAAGIDEVLSRGAFASQLPQLLAPHAPDHP